MTALTIGSRGAQRKKEYNKRARVLSRFFDFRLIWFQNTIFYKRKNKNAIFCILIRIQSEWSMAI